MKEKIEKSLAKLSGFDVGVEDHGCFVMHGTFRYEDGGAQGFGYVINADFIEGVIGVFGVDALQRVNGKSCWVYHTSSNISRLEPLHKSDGKAFDISEWSEKCKKKEAR